MRDSTTAADDAMVSRSLINCSRVRMVRYCCSHLDDLYMHWRGVRAVLSFPALSIVAFVFRALMYFVFNDDTPSQGSRMDWCFVDQ